MASSRAAIARVYGGWLAVQAPAKHSRRPEGELRQRLQEGVARHTLGAKTEQVVCRHLAINQLDAPVLQLLDQVIKPSFDALLTLLNIDSPKNTLPSATPYSPTSCSCSQTPTE